MYYKYKKEEFQPDIKDITEIKASSTSTSGSSSSGLYIGISVSVVAVILVGCLILYNRKKDKQNFGFRFY
jgi:hypothetical protein